VKIAALTLLAAVFSAGCIGLPQGGGNQPPIADFTLSKSLVEINEAVVFNASASHDPDGQIGVYQWNFGDGVQDTGATVTHRYGAFGRLVVTLTVTDTQGAQSAHAANLTVNAPPKAAFEVTLGPYFAKEPISFAATGSGDPDGLIATYAWDFGDGSQGSSFAVAHAYAVSGTFVIRLTVTDGAGARANASTSLFVDLHTYQVAFTQDSSQLQPIRNFTLANQTKSITVEIFVTNLTRANFTLTWRDPFPAGGPPNDVIELRVTSPEGSVQHAQGTFDNITLGFNLNPIPPDVTVRAATAADVPGALGSAFLGMRGTGVWLVEIVAVSLQGGVVQDGGFVPEPLFVWTLTTTLTTYHAQPTQVG